MKNKLNNKMLTNLNNSKKTDEDLKKELDGLLTRETLKKDRAALARIKKRSRLFEIVAWIAISFQVLSLIGHLIIGNYLLFFYQLMFVIMLFLFIKNDKLKGSMTELILEQSTLIKNLVDDIFKLKEVIREGTRDTINISFGNSKKPKKNGKKK